MRSLLDIEAETSLQSKVALERPKDRRRDSLAEKPVENVFVSSLKLPLINFFVLDYLHFGACPVF